MVFYVVCPSIPARFGDSTRPRPFAGGMRVFTRVIEQTGAQVGQSTFQAHVRIDLEDGSCRSAVPLPWYLDRSGRGQEMELLNKSANVPGKTVNHTWATAKLRNLPLGARQARHYPRTGRLPCGLGARGPFCNYGCVAGDHADV